jgi:hypothetical protein
MNVVALAIAEPLLISFLQTCLMCWTVNWSQGSLSYA